MKTVKIMYGIYEFVIKDDLPRGIHRLGPDEDAVKIRGERPEYPYTNRTKECHISPPTLREIEESFKRIVALEEGILY